MTASGSGTILITGGTGALSRACARSLLQAAERGPDFKVVLACRDTAAGMRTAADLRGEFGARASEANIDVVHCDLGELASVRQCAAGILQRTTSGDWSPLSGLVCAAGVQGATSIRFTVDGFERTFAVNHIGHFLLVNLCRPALAPGCRVIVVSSATHDPDQKTGMPEPAWNSPRALARGELGVAARGDRALNASLRRYSTSKLANVIFAHELARRTPAISVNAFDPGLMPGTGLLRDAPPPVRWLWRHALPKALPLLRRVVSENIHTPAQSGAALSELLLRPDLGAVTGRYFEGIREIQSSRQSYDPELGRELWDETSLLCDRASMPA